MKFLLFLFLFAYVSSTMQSQKYGGIVKYTQSFDNSAVNMSTDFELYFSKELSIYLEVPETNKFLLKSESDKKGSSNFSTQTIRIKPENKPDFYINNRFDRSFYFGTKPFEKRIVVKENDNLYTWERIDSTKTIGGYICHKATTNFRGRDYVAWYTKEIPVSYGPWKLNALEGLILEAYDESLSFKVVASSINLEAEAPGEMPILKMTLNLDSAMSLDEYLNYKKEGVNEIFERMSSKLPKGSAPLKIADDCSDCPAGLEIFNE